jgi:hypothetical protein
MATSIACRESLATLRSNHSPVGTSPAAFHAAARAGGGYRSRFNPPPASWPGETAVLGGIDTWAFQFQSAPASWPGETPFTNVLTREIEYLFHSAPDFVARGNDCPPTLYLCSWSFQSAAGFVARTKKKGTHLGRTLRFPLFPAFSPKEAAISYPPLYRAHDRSRSHHCWEGSGPNSIRLPSESRTTKCPSTPSRVKAPSTTIACPHQTKQRSIRPYSEYIVTNGLPSSLNCWPRTACTCFTVMPPCRRRTF